MTARPVAVVTGGCAGIGWEISQRLIHDGFHVISLDLVPGLSEQAPHTHFSWVETDVTDPESVHGAFSAIAAQGDGLGVLVNNAGIQIHRPLENLTFDEWEAVVGVNLHGAFLCLQAAGHIMLQQGAGAIVNISSIASRGSGGRAPYATTKAALLGLTATAGAEWADRGVRVNAVAPGYVDTGVLRQGLEQGTLRLEPILARIPMTRLASAKEIASAVSFLVSDESSYITGQTLFVDGGFSVDYGVPLVSAPTD